MTRHQTDEPTRIAPAPDTGAGRCGPTRLEQAARLAEYDLWRIWPILDARPAPLPHALPDLAEVLDALQDGGTELALHELVRCVMRHCTRHLGPERMLVWVLLANRVERNPGIRRLLQED